jgi:Lon protease-like protein
MNGLTAIFPLETVVFPGDELNLHIFEPRYQELINDCAETKMPFGIPAVVNRQIGKFGTLVELAVIRNVRPNGEMDIRTNATKIFHINRLVKLYPNKLYSGAEVDYPANELQPDAKLMREVLAGVKQLHALLEVKKKFSKANEPLVSYDVAHDAGLSLVQEYELLGMFDECGRLEYLQRHLERVLPVVSQMESLKEKIQLNGYFKNLPGFEVP